MRCDQCDDDTEYTYCDDCWNALKYADYGDDGDEY